ncbi:MAG: class I SAM-dependent methyltransferase [Chthoniobacterales bacterium]
MSQLLPTSSTLMPKTGGASLPGTHAAPVELPGEESLFEHFAWLYAFLREHIFRDDTQRIVQALWPEGAPPPPHARLMELGCGPGFYSCQIAHRFPELTVLGVDRSGRQLDWARAKAIVLRLRNCSFEKENVLELSRGASGFEAVIASRLFTVLPEPERAVSEMHRILRPGGRCFVAEPRYALWATLPLFAMWILAGATRRKNACREPGRAKVLSPRAFETLFASQPWRSMRTWQDGRYQYALCEKG